MTKQAEASAEIEGTGTFYLGRYRDAEKGQTTSKPVLYDAKDLTTHAMCVGMTGSGKTGLCIGVLEEAALDGIPALVIDPKGDLGNLLLTFPDLRSEDFLPFIDPTTAVQAGVSVEELAAQRAQQWREGLAAWGQDGERIRRLKAAADFALYTPGSRAARPLRVLQALDAPAESLRTDVEALRERVSATVGGLLGLLGVGADPVQSRESILLSTILETAWREGRSLGLPDLIQQVQTPGVDRIGVLNLESFYPEKERFQLALALNNLLASPTFKGWLEGDPLDVQSLLFTPQGKPRVSVLSIAHLDDAERMFFVTLLLTEVVAWMRAQAGTPSLRALLYMDEVFGFLPPVANPPSKPPFLTLLKQARAFGLGIVLATQNPVDLDYKALSNMGTWFLGRLQTERDKLRVLDGLEGAAASTFDRDWMDRTLSGLKKRVFLLHNVHESQPALFETRWVLSFLAGPLTPAQMRRLVPSQASEPEAKMQAEPASARAAAPVAARGGTGDEGGRRPLLPPEVAQRFLSPSRPLPAGSRLLYRPALHARARLHYVDRPSGLDHWKETGLVVLLGRGSEDLWTEAERLGGGDLVLGEAPEDDRAEYAPLPPAAGTAEFFTRQREALEDHLYREEHHPRWRCRALRLSSEVDEDREAFRQRVQDEARATLSREEAELDEAYAARISRQEESIRRAEQRLEDQQAQHARAKRGIWIRILEVLVGLFVGRRGLSRGALGKAGTAMRSRGRAAEEKQDVEQAAANLDAERKELEALENRQTQERKTLQTRWDPASLPIEEDPVQPRKSDLRVDRFYWLWTPWIVTAGGGSEAAYDL